MISRGQELAIQNITAMEVRHLHLACVIHISHQWANISTLITTISLSRGIIKFDNNK